MIRPPSGGHTVAAEADLHRGAVSRVTARARGGFDDAVELPRDEDGRTVGRKLERTDLGEVNVHGLHVAGSGFQTVEIRPLERPMAARLARVVIPSVTVPVPPTYTDVVYLNHVQLGARSDADAGAPARVHRARPAGGDLGHPPAYCTANGPEFPARYAELPEIAMSFTEASASGFQAVRLPFTVEKAATFLRRGAAGLTEGTSHVKRGAVGRKR